MAPQINLLKEFYDGLPKDRAKVETYEHGFDFLESVMTGGMTLTYGELTPTGLLHKYKFGNISEARMDALLEAHVGKRCNVCLYFDGAANRLFCLNLDNNHKTGNTVVIPEMSAAVGHLRAQLTALGCEPLIIASGRGYHVWCRLEAAVANERLYGFMLRVAAKTMAALHYEGLDYHKVKFNLYPDCRIQDFVSLRLFGSEHAKNKVFSRILTPETLLDEAGSWAAFEHHLRHKNIPLAKFEAACESLELLR